MQLPSWPGNVRIWHYCHLGGAYFTMYIVSPVNSAKFELKLQLFYLVVQWPKVGSNDEKNWMSKISLD